MKILPLFLVLPTVALALASTALAQSLVTIETVAVGDPGNAADTTGYGSVADAFAIGKYEVTISQYTTFLNSVATTNTNSYIVNLWTSDMTANASIGGVINRSGSLGSYSYSTIASGNRPMPWASWFSAARFANWLNNGATNGASTETGAYTLNGATTGIITKNAGATWFLPSEDQWYKAAYYKGGGTNAGYWDYPTASDTQPTAEVPPGGTNSANYNNVRPDGTNKLTDVGSYIGSDSGYGTFDQGGNLYEWNDAVIGSSRGLRGGDWGWNGGPGMVSSGRGSDLPTTYNSSIGFRVATVPEPSTFVLLLAGTAALCARWRIRSQR